MATGIVRCISAFERLWVSRFPWASVGQRVAFWGRGSQQSKTGSAGECIIVVQCRSPCSGNRGGDLKRAISKPFKDSRHSGKSHKQHMLSIMASAPLLSFFSSAQ